MLIDTDSLTPEDFDIAIRAIEDTLALVHKLDIPIALRIGIYAIASAREAKARVHRLKVREYIEDALGPITDEQWGNLIAMTMKKDDS